MTNEIIEPIKEYDKEGRLIHIIFGDGSEDWYDANENLIHSKDVLNEIWNDYDDNGNLTHSKIVRASNNSVYEIWQEYDTKGNKIRFRDSRGYEETRKYDERGNKISVKNNLTEDDVLVQWKNGKKVLI